MEDFDCEKFENRLKNLKDTQDSITGLSKWCLNKRVAHKSIVKCWLKVLKEVKIEQRLTLFYLANDVIQHSKRKNYEFVDSWATTLQRASTLVRDDARVKDKVSRIFNIWQQREVYAEDFITDLNGLLLINQVKKPLFTPSATTSYTASPVSSPTHRSDDNEDEFQLQSLISNIKSCVSLETETDKNLKHVIKASVPDIEKVRNSLKDRTQVEEVEKEVENASTKHELFINSINSEIKARKTLLTALEQAERFYRNQRRDVKKVVYAYKNFGDRIKTIQSELNKKMSHLPSPIPSPDINAPSPEPDNDDFDLPADVNFYNANMNGTFGSFMSDGPLPFDVNEFYRESPPPVEHNQSIQVIQSQDQQLATAPLNDFYNNIMPQKLEAYNPALGYNDSYRQPQQPPLPSAAPPMNFALCTAPPPPPPTSQNNNQSLNSSNNDDYSWNDWNMHHIDTPVSPANYERKGHDESSIVEYVDESLRDIDSSLNDIDHRQLFRADIETKDVDHRNLISLTGSPSQMQNNIPMHPTNGNNDFIPPMLDHSQMNYPPHPGMSNFPTQHRNQRPPLLPTPNMPPMRYSRNMSINSDSSKGPDELESSEMDMELSDDDLSGIDGNMSNDFYNINQNMHSHPPRYQPHPISLNRPPPSLPLDNDPMNQQRKSWIHNNAGNSDLPPLDDIDLPDPQQTPIGIPTPNSNFNPGFRPRNPNNFRGQNRGGKMMRGGMNSNNGNGNNSPYNLNNNFKNRGRGRGGFRGGNNFRGSQW
ncbi:unnamed protein product [Chironomus riparius]|uniref:Regulation of nuclear pre-mRNA domain-containing protein 2 n=1 Tax=Chironomus riparius TaxID=315576 RepID=A0A9N9RI08_9DIPT|nr:unnamed protein product [Chironomus riparius]